MADKIKKISDESIRLLKKQSVLTVGRNPSEKGLSPQKIVEALANPTFKTIEEINRIIDEINIFVNDAPTTEYILNSLDSLNSKNNVNEKNIQDLQSLTNDLKDYYFNSLGIKYIPEILDPKNLINIYTDLGDGKYSITTTEFGAELVIVDTTNKLFKRFTAGYDYTFDFELNSWLIASGGGGGTGGGGGGAGIVYLKTISPLQQTVALNTKVVLRYNVNFSVSNEGTLQVYANETLKKSVNITEGDNEIEITDYLRQGVNTIRIVLTDLVGSTGSLIYQIDAISLRLTSTFNDNRAYTGDIDFRFIPYGAVEKTVTFYVDDEEYATQTILETGTSQQQIIEDLTHGVHKLKVTMSAVVDENTIESNELNYNIIVYEADNDEILISSKFGVEEVTQGELISIDYLVYNPLSETTDVKLYINDDKVNELIIDRTRQYWNTTNYPKGNVTFKIVANEGLENEKALEFDVLVNEAQINVQPVTNNLHLYLSAKDRTNSDSNKENWSYNDIQATLTGFNWNTNGWLLDNKGYNVLRLNGKAKVEIPYQIFATDFLSYGKTIEVEFATKDLVNINAEVMTCWSGNKGIKIYANKCVLKSEQSEIVTKFKEDEKLKVAFVVQTSSEQRLIKTFINGILSGTTLYPANDNFTQTTPVNIVIGSENAGIDIYSIRIYNSALTDKENLNNYLSDLSFGELLTEYTKNDILNDYGQVSFEKVKNLIPTMIVTGRMPSVKGDKTNVSVKYSNPRNGSYDFEYFDVIWDIQGTSSQYYPRKNYKGKFPNVFEFYEGGIPENVYTFKADYMESSHSHNTGNAKIINKYSPKFPSQEYDDRVRNSINGFPILMFVRKDESSELEYYGVYNFNNDKGNNATIGLNTDTSESWEFKNNTSDRCNFLTDDFTGAVSDDFEARYPDKYTNYTNLERVVSWVYSTKDNIEKFKDEFKQYFDKDFCLFYYVMMDIMLAVDSRAKNMFLDTVDGVIWYPRWYDIDTTYGLNNEGGLQFEYGLEQTDEVENVAVYNGNNSLLWNNFGEAFADDIKDYYKELRKQITYDSMLSVLQEEQIDKISANMYNTDADFKYIKPLIEQNDSTYLYVAQGNRLNHLQWWLNNRFKYLDSKYEASDYENDFITMRLYTPELYEGVEPSGNFNIKPYIDMYSTVKFGSSVVKERSKANETTLVESPEGLTFNNTETIIYGASNILDIGDLSNKYARTMDFSKATKLNKLIIGSQITGYSNTNLTDLQIGNNSLLEEIDVSNCPNLKTTLDLSKCLNIKKIYASGSGIRGVTLASGGNLTNMKLPNVSSLIVTNQPSLTELTVDNYTNLTTLRLENINNSISRRFLINSIDYVERVRITNVDWTFTNSQQFVLNTLMSKLGLSVDGSPYEKAVLTGKVHIEGEISEADYNRWIAYFGNNLQITADYIMPFYSIKFVNYDNTVLYETEIIEGSVVSYIGNTPTKPSDEEYYYEFIGWNPDITQPIYQDTTFIAQFNAIELLSVKWVNYDNTVLYELKVEPNTSVSYEGSVPQKPDDEIYENYIFSNWLGSNGNTYYMGSSINITEDLILTAQFTGSLKTFDVHWYNGDVLLLTTNVVYGETAEYSGDTPVSAEGYSFVGWSKTPNSSVADENLTITSETNLYACFDKPDTLEATSKVYSATPKFKLASCTGVDEEITIDWGDGYVSTHTITTSETECASPRTFYEGKNYTIKMPATENYKISGKNSSVIFNSASFKYWRIGAGSFFKESKITHFSIPPVSSKIGITEIPESTFSYCSSLTSINISEGITKIGNGAFNHCSSLTSINIPSGVTTIGIYPFSGCVNITSITVDKNNTVFDSRNNCNAIIQTDINELRVGCSTTVIPNNVESLGTYAFHEMTNLTLIEIPKSVTRIKASSFGGCTSLKNIIIHNETPPSLDSNALPKNLESIKVPTFEALLAYREATNWNAYDKLYTTDDYGLLEISNQVLGLNIVTSKNVTLPYFGDNPTFTVISDDTSICEASFSGDVLTITAKGAGTTNITATMAGGEKTFTQTFSVTVYETLSEYTYSVEAIDGVTYGFALNDSGYYESTNQGESSSFSLCKLSFTANGAQNLYLDCINSGENGIDFGILSNVDTTLSSSNITDTSNVFKSFKGLSSTDVQTVDYGIIPAGEHFIYIKYTKDWKNNSGNDSLQFKVRIE